MTRTYAVQVEAADEEEAYRIATDLDLAAWDNVDYEYFVSRID